MLKKFSGIGLIALVVLIPILDSNAYHIDVLVSAGIFVLLALGLNVIVGFAGILNLGFAALYAVGAYSYALLSVHLHLPFWPGLLISGILTSCFAMLLAFPALRLSGDYLAIVTLGAGEIVRIVLNNWDRVTGGPNGILGIAHPTVAFFNYDFGVKSTPYYYLLLVLIVISMACLDRIAKSRIGRAWLALREDELAATCMGVSPVWAKLLAFAIGGFMAGLAGCIFAAKQGAVSPDSFDFILSVMVLAMVVLGGLGSIRGAVVGALVLSLLPEVFRSFDVYRMLLFGLAMIAMMLFRPQGLIAASHTKATFRSSEPEPSSS